MCQFSRPDFYEISEDMNELQSCLQFLALSEAQQRKYLACKVEKPLGIRCPEVEITTKKPLLIVTIVTLSKTKSCPEQWFESLSAEQVNALQELDAVLTMMIESGLWDIFSLDELEREHVSPYIKVWGACRTLADCVLKRLGWSASWPELPFSYFLKEYTCEVKDNFPEELLR